MKRKIFMALALFLTLAANAQQSELTDPNVKMYLKLDASNNRELVMGVCFENKSGRPMASISFDMEMPNGLTVLSADRGSILQSNHEIVVEKYNYSGLNHWFFLCYNFAPTAMSNRQFTNDGRVCTLTLDTSALTDGQFSIIVRNAEVVWSDGYDVKAYKTPDFSFQFHVNDLPTDIKGVEDVDIDRRPADTTHQGTYNLQGVKVEKMQPGRIYIIDGKKVIVK